MTAETFSLFYKAITQGLIMGFCTAALLGPVNALAVRRGIMGGFQQIIGVGSGAALVDAIWAYVVFAGLIKVGIVGIGKIIVWGLSAVFLLYLAYSMLMEIRDNPEMMHNPKVSKQIRFIDDSFVMGFLIAATNPFSLLRWIGLVATLDVAGNIDLTGGAATSFFSAVLVSEMVWFFGLGLVVQYSRNLFDRRALRIIKWVCGLILLGYYLFMASKVVIILIHTGEAPLIP
ncbi:MAG TPA: LysE family transporter [bacterium]|nr:LysE family transporter [bacterium]